MPQIKQTKVVHPKHKYAPTILIVTFIIMVVLVIVSTLGGQTKHCSSHGRWTGEYCLCDYGYSDTRCQTWSCRSSDDCGGQRNRCVRGKCVCDASSAQGARCDGRAIPLESNVYGRCYPTMRFQPWAPSGTIIWMIVATIVFIWWIYQMRIKHSSDS
ncbi:MAG: hypothetical protein QF704_11135, partial [Anaerolineales bacterium]|nr:hypothetical protein [Anaerolineales bacterium]